MLQPHSLTEYQLVPAARHHDTSSFTVHVTSQWSLVFRERATASTCTQKSSWQGLLVFEVASQRPSSSAQYRVSAIIPTYTTPKSGQGAVFTHSTSYPSDCRRFVASRPNSKRIPHISCRIPVTTNTQRWTPEQYHLSYFVSCQLSNPRPHRVPATGQHPKSRRQPFSSIRHPGDHVHLGPNVASQRLSPPQGRPTCPLVHSTSRPSDPLHLHPNVDYLQMPCCLPATTYTKSAADAPSCAWKIAPQQSSPPAPRHCIPATIYTH